MQVSKKEIIFYFIGLCFIVGFSVATYIFNNRRATVYNKIDELQYANYNNYHIVLHSYREALYKASIPIPRPSLNENLRNYDDQLNQHLSDLYFNGIYLTVSIAMILLPIILWITFMIFCKIYKI
jgi:hypothetical protein